MMKVYEVSGTIFVYGLLCPNGFEKIGGYLFRTEEAIDEVDIRRYRCVNSKAVKKHFEAPEHEETDESFYDTDIDLRWNRHERICKREMRTGVRLFFLPLSIGMNCFMEEVKPTERDLTKLDFRALIIHYPMFVKAKKPAVHYVNSLGLLEIKKSDDDNPATGQNNIAYSPFL